MAMRGGIWPVSLTGEEVLRNDSNTVSLRYVTPGYFGTLGIPIRRGRDVAETDTREQPFVQGLTAGAPTSQRSRRRRVARRAGTPSVLTAQLSECRRLPQRAGNASRGAITRVHS